ALCLHVPGRGPAVHGGGPRRADSWWPAYRLAPDDRPRRPEGGLPHRRRHRVRGGQRGSGDGGHRGVRGSAVKRVGLGLLFFAWLYGVPFLLIVGLIRRTSTPYAPTRADAHAYAATTDRILTWALILNAALVFAGLLLSRLTADDAWWRRFMWSIAWMMGVYVAVSLAA